MFQKRETTQKQINREKTRKKNKQKMGMNNTYHEPLSEEWIGRRS